MTTTSNKITAIYCRLSREDEQKGDVSNSIKNQEVMLRTQAEKLGLRNIQVFIDDGISGVFQETRPAFNEILTLISDGVISALIVKDLSRAGRNYHETGELTETILPYFGVRFVALNDGIDQRNDVKNNQKGGLDILVAFKNLMNEAYVQDISVKVRSSQVAKNSQGYAIGKPPYGYIRSQENPKLWVVDVEASIIVKKIFDFRLKDKLSVNGIANILCEENIKKPSHHKFEKGYSTLVPKNSDKFDWKESVVRCILCNQCYTGDVVNFKTYTYSYKDKRKYHNEKEDWAIHPNVHETIVSREDFEEVQKSFLKNVREASTVPKNTLAGFLYCSDCGSKMNFRQDKLRPHNNSFICGNNRRNKRYCKKTHQIPVSYIEQIVLNNISKLVSYADSFYDDFLNILMDKQAEKKYQELKALTDMNNIGKARKLEIETVFKRMYEDRIKGLITEEQFTLLAGDFTKEQQILLEEIGGQDKLIAKLAKQKFSKQKLTKMLRMFTSVNELNDEIMELFVDKIVIHHRDEHSTTRKQKVDIHYNFLGHIDVPTLSKKERAQYQKNFGRPVVPEVVKKELSHANMTA